MRQHNPNSPFLIGTVKEGDIIREAKQDSYRNEQITLF